MEDKKYYYGFHMHTFFEEEYYNSREEALKEANLKNCDNKLYIYTAEVSTYDGYKEDNVKNIERHHAEVNWSWSITD